MARIFMDGFELGDTSLWGSSSYPQISNSSFPAGFSGIYYLTFASASGWIEKNMPSSKTELYFAFKYYASFSFNAAIITFKDSAGTVIGTIIRNTSTRYLEFRCGSDNTTVQATGTIQTFALKTYLIEIRYKPLNTSGIVTIKIDGVQDINYSGDTTAGLENVQTIRLGKETFADADYIKYDDFVIDDANWIGNTKVGIIVPDGTGTTNNWTASAGNAWDCLNEKPPVDTDYVYSNTTNQIATYAMTTIANMNSIKLIQLQGRAAYEGSPTPTKIQLGVRASGADYFATDFSPGVGFGMFTKILELNPADSAAFEQADIDALEVGVKAVA